MVTKKATTEVKKAAPKAKAVKVLLDMDKVRGATLRALRAAIGLSQTTVAEKAKVDRKVLSALETGKVPSYHDYAAEIKAVLAFYTKQGVGVVANEDEDKASHVVIAIEKKKVSM